MVRIFSYIFGLVFACFVISGDAMASAQLSQGQSQEQSQSADQSLDDLIKTLESPQERQEFIDKLKSIAETEEQSEDESALSTVTDVFNIEAEAESLVQEIESFLEDHGLNASYLGRALSTLGIFFIFWLCCFIVLKLSRSVRDRLLPLAGRYAVDVDRIRLYNRIVRYVVYGLLAIVFFYFIGMLWGLYEGEKIGDFILFDFVSRFFSIFVLIFVALLIWEIISGAIEMAMRRVTGSYSKRLYTLLPIIRNVLMVTYSLIITLVILSEIGVDIMPLLAGAGVLGIAIGFGAQTMVKDFLTGFIIIIEDLIQVGDVAGVGGKTGLVEKISIRKVQLRDLDGTVYTVPFSEITVVSNLTKDFSFYLLDVGIAYREDPDEVVKLLKEIDEEMREDEDYKNLILEPLQVLGVDQFGDSAIVIKARIKTLPIKQWDVGREFNRRMKYKFDEHNIEIPFPHQTLYFGEDKNGKAPPAHIAIDDKTKPKKAKKTSSNKSKEADKAAKKNAKSTESHQPSD